MSFCGKFKTGLMSQVKRASQIFMNIGGGLQSLRNIVQKRFIIKNKTTSNSLWGNF
eukprot:UN16112